MGSVLQRQRDSTHSSSPTGALSPSPACSHSISESSPSRQRPDESFPPLDIDAAGDGQKGNSHGFALPAVQSGAVSSLHVTKPEGFSLSSDQRARMDYHKALALAKRKEKLNKLTHAQYSPVQSTLSSQEDHHLCRTLPPEQANYGGTADVTTHSAPSSQHDVLSGSTLGLAKRHAVPSYPEIRGVPTFACTKCAASLQHGFGDLHQDVYGSSILTCTCTAQTSQRDRHSVLVSVNNSQLLQQNNQGGLDSTSKHNPSSSLCGHRTSQQQICQSNSAVNSPCDGSFLTLEQRACVTCKREKALAKLKERQKRELHLSEIGTSQCVVADRSSGFLSRESYQNENRDVSPAMLSQLPQVSYRRPSYFVQDLHHTSWLGLAFSQQDARSCSSLTQDQRVRMAHQKEMAIARRKARLPQRDEYCHPRLTYSQCLASSQQDTYNGSSLTQVQRARIAHLKEIAIARCNVSLQQQQQEEHHHMLHKPAGGEQGTAQICMKSQKFAGDLVTNCVGDCFQSVSLTQEQRARMAHQKDMAIARRNARLQQQQQQLDERHLVHHKPPIRKQGTAAVGMNSQKFATNLLPNYSVEHLM